MKRYESENCGIVCKRYSLLGSLNFVGFGIAHVIWMNV